MNDHQELRKSVQEQTYSYPEHVAALLADFDRLLEALKKIHNSNMCGDDCRTVAMNALLGVQS